MPSLLSLQTITLKAHSPREKRGSAEFASDGKIVGLAMISVRLRMENILLQSVGDLLGLVVVASTNALCHV